MPPLARGGPPQGAPAAGPRPRPAVQPPPTHTHTGPRSRRAATPAGGGPTGQRRPASRRGTCACSPIRDAGGCGTGPLGTTWDQGGLMSEHRYGVNRRRPNQRRVRSGASRGGAALEEPGLAFAVGGREPPAFAFGGRRRAGDRRRDAILAEARPDARPARRGGDRPSRAPAQRRRVSVLGLSRRRSAGGPPHRIAARPVGLRRSSSAAPSPTARPHRDGAAKEPRPSKELPVQV